MKLNYNREYCIYVKNYNEWVDIQKYLFKRNYSWLDMQKNLFTKWFRTGNKGYENLIFPRCLLIINYNSKYYMANVENSNESCLKNRENFPELKASELLRKEKLEKLKCL